MPHLNSISLSSHSSPTYANYYVVFIEYRSWQSTVQLCTGTIMRFLSESLSAKNFPFPHEQRTAVNIDINYRYVKALSVLERLQSVTVSGTIHRKKVIIGHVTDIYFPIFSKKNHHLIVRLILP